MKLDLSNRQQWLGVLAIGAVALLAGDRLVFSPLVENWKSRSKRLVALREDVHKGEGLLSREKSLREQWARITTNSLPSETSTAESAVLKAFERYADESRISINSIRPQHQPNNEGYATVNCRVDAVGNLAAITRFLYDIEKDPLALKIDSVELSARDDGGDQLALGLQVSGLLLSPPAKR